MFKDKYISGLLRLKRILKQNKDPVVSQFQKGYVDGEANKQSEAVDITLNVPQSALDFFK